MLGLALAILPKFPLSGVWQPPTYQIGLHVQAEDAALARVPSGTTVEATLTMVAPLAARDDTYWIGTGGDPAPRYIVFDSTNSGWSPAPVDPLAFVEARHPGASYRQIFTDNGVYVFRQTSETGYRPVACLRPVARVGVGPLGRPQMDFAYDARTEELRERLLSFMDSHVYPAEKVFADAGGRGEPRGRMALGAAAHHRRAEGGGAQPGAVEPVPGPPPGGRRADQPAVRAAGRDHRAQPGARARRR